MIQGFEIEGVRYVPEKLTYKGVRGYLWKRWEHNGTVWALDGKLFQPLRTTRAKVVEAFDYFDNTGCE